MKKILPIFGIIIGLIMVTAYPAYDAYHTWKANKQVKQLDNNVSRQTDSDISQFLEQAKAYNEKLAGNTPSISPVWSYEKQLNISGENTAFAELIIPVIAIDMPVYHGTSEAVLSAGVGHLQGSALPIGGKSTHCVLTAHSGMPGMRAFDDLRNLKTGNVFAIRTLGKLYAYKVYDSEVILPKEIDKLKVEQGKDLCTLITCTPYGVNTHRLLVHGKRCKVPKDFFNQHPSIKDIIKNRRYLPFFIGITLVLLLIITTIITKLRKKRKTQGKGFNYD